MSSYAADRYEWNSRDPVRYGRGRDSNPLKRYLVNSIVCFLLIPCIAILSSFLFPHNSSSASLSHRFLQSTKQAQVLSHPRDFPRPPYALFSTKVVLPSDEMRPAYVLVGANGKISDVTSSLVRTPREFRRVIVDVTPLVVMPGLIDPHVHVNAPGREEWEGFDHATRAAAAGGTTTILDMPLNNVPSVTNADALALKFQALASSNSLVDVGLIGGIVHGNHDDIQRLIDGGVVAMKSFMIDSQSPDFPHVTREDMAEAVEELDRITSKAAVAIKPIPYILHAELDDGAPTTGARAQANEAYDHMSYDHFERSRPDSWETKAIQMAAEVANNSNLHIHIAHVSSHEAVKLISELRSSPYNHGRITAETCTQYLLWAKEEIPPGATHFKCAPPIRSNANRQRMLETVFHNSEYREAIDLIASDHSPCPEEMKNTRGNITHAWGGIAGLQYRLQGSWTAATSMDASVVEMSKLLSEGPATVFGLDNLKGSLKAPLDADMVIWDPQAEGTLREEDSEHRHKTSSFHGAKIRGLVAYTLLRGEQVYSSGSQSSREKRFGIAKGRLLYRSSEDGIVRMANRHDWRTAHEPGHE